ncbi:YidC/Oxa1 family membrane protein insertase [Candidatus Saccharibacteria bacterium]|nr:YidC/Oxa1 family membrane protein insertase [Candidatus Saccharibacteria bacterium]
MNIFDILIVQPIFNLLLGIYTVVPGSDFGVSIIIFTILLRFVMYPLVKRQLHQVKKMRKLQPELQRIKRQTKGNKQQEGLLMMELYKKHGVSPFRTIGILLVQLPIFIALYHVIQVLTLHRDQVAKYTYDFLENIPAIEQIIKHPEQFNEKLFGIIDLTKHAFSNGSVDIFLVFLAVVAAITQFIMSKQTTPQTTSTKKLREILAEASAGKEADQSEINGIIMGKMMYFLPFFMLFIMLNLPGAIALYYAVSNIVATIQQHFILKQDEEEMEEMVENTPAQPSKKATAKARAKQADEATVTRIVAGGAKSKKHSKK